MIRYITKDKRLFVLLVVLMLVGGTMGTLFSLVMSSLTDCAMGSRGDLYATLLRSVVFVVVCVFSQAAYRYVKNCVIAEARRGLKDDLFRSIYHRSMAEFEQGSSAKYINELSNQVNLFENTYFQNIISVGDLLVSFLSAALICVYVQPVMLLIMLALAVLTLGVTKVTTKPLERSMKEYGGRLEEYTQEIKDDFTGFDIIYLFHSIRPVVDRHGRANAAMETAKRKNENCQMYCAYTGQLVGLLSTVLVMAAAAYFSQKGAISAGMIIAFGHLIGKIVSPITSIPSVVAGFHAARPIGNEFQDILRSADAGKGKGKAVSEGDIVLEQVSFGYGDRLILNGCTCRFERDGRYVLLGNSGEGKSSLLRLIAGVHQSYEGDILMGDTELRTADREKLSEAVAMVKQDTFLFQDTVRNNITLFRDDYSERQLSEAVERAGLKETVAALPEGLDTLLCENGSNLSGGERQRIGLARAILRNARVLLLDEFTANLDQETARELEDYILSMTNRTIITVTHRRDAEMLRKYDRVYVLRNGRLEEAKPEEA